MEKQALWEGHNWAGTQRHGEEVQGRGSSIWKHPRQDADVLAAGWAVGLVGSCSSSDPKTHASPLTSFSSFHSALFPACPNPFPFSYSFHLFLSPLLNFPPTLSLTPSPFPSLTSCLSLTHSLSLHLSTCPDIMVWRSSCGKNSQPGSIWVFFLLAQTRECRHKQNMPKGRGRREAYYGRTHSIFIFPPLIDGWKKRSSTH